MAFCVYPLGRPAPFVNSFMVGREDKRTNNRTMLSTLKNNAAAGYQGPGKIQLLKGAGLLQPLIVVDTKVYLIRAVIGLGGWGEIIYGLRRQPEEPSVC